LYGLLLLPQPAISASSSVHLLFVGAVIPAGQCIASPTNHETAMAQDDILGQKVDPAG